MKQVNRDIKDQIARLKQEVERGEKTKNGSLRVIEDLKKKYEDIRMNGDMTEIVE